MGKAKRAHHVTVDARDGGHGARAPLPTLRARFAMQTIFSDRCSDSLTNLRHRKRVEFSPMNSFDIVVYLGLTIAIVIGFKTGLLRSAIAILAYLVAMPIAMGDVNGGAATRGPAALPFSQNGSCSSGSSWSRAWGSESSPGWRWTTPSDRKPVWQIASAGPPLARSASA